MLLALPGAAAASGNDSIETRSECLVSLLLSPDLLLICDSVEAVGAVKAVDFERLDCVTVVLETFEAVSEVESIVSNVSTDAIVDKRCSPVVGAILLGNARSGFPLFDRSRLECLGIGGFKSGDSFSATLGLS